MEITSLHPLSISKIKNVVIDLIALLAIYLVPSVSHLLGFPVYYLEPIRMMLILGVVHTSRKNAYLIALTLPLFSMLISAHPALVKTSLITGELLLNVWLFFFFEKMSNKTLAIFLSIIVSKIFYYLVKFILITSVLMSGDLISTPMYIQILMLFVFSGYIFLMSFDRGK